MTPMLRTWLRPLVILALIAALNGRAIATSLQITGASHDRHVWFVQSDEDNDRHELCHLATTMDGASYRRHMRIPAHPEAMAAWENALWIVMAPTTNARGESRRNVFSLQIFYEEAFDLYYSVPKQRLDVVPDLPGWGILVGFAGGSDGPIALLYDASAPDGARVELLTLRKGSWKSIDDPGDARLGRPVGMARAGEDGDRLVIAAMHRDAGIGTRAWSYERGEWTYQDVPLNPTGLEAMFTVGPHVAAGVALDAEQLEIAYLRTTGALPLATIDRPPTRWGLFGLDEMIGVLREGDGETLHWRSLDPLTGETAAEQDLVARAPASAKMLLTSILAACSITAVMATLLLRPPPPATLPEGYRLAGPGKRLLGAIVDVLPSVGLAIALAGRPAIEITNLPLLTNVDVTQCIPYLLTAAITALHTGVFQAVGRRSVGQMIAGARLARIDGDPMRGRQIVVRTLMLLLLFIIPPLVVVMLFSPHGQGLHDQLARTVVVRNRTEPIE